MIFTRRQFMALSAASLLASASNIAAQTSPMLSKTIPATGEEFSSIDVN